MNDICLWCLSAMTALIALSTIWRLGSESNRFRSEDLTDYDRAFAWRIVVFLVFPALTFLDLRTTMVATNLFGGYVSSWAYGLMWYHVQPMGLNAVSHLAITLLAGVILQLLLAICLLPALLFRPHPFLATLIGYTAAFTFGLNLIADPLLSLVGIGSPRWQVIYDILPGIQRTEVFFVHFALAIAYLLVMFSQRVRFWFAGLSRPNVAQELEQALSNWQSCPDNPRLACMLVLLYDQAGMRRKAKVQFKRVKKAFPQSLYSLFLDGLLSYRRRNYKAAKYAFLSTAEYPGVEGGLKANFLAAAACAAFAQDDLSAAQSLCEQALALDPACLVSHMVKVDLLLRHGKKKEAADELLIAVSNGLNADLGSKVPLDWEQTLNAIVNLEKKKQLAASHLVF